MKRAAENALTKRILTVAQMKEDFGILKKTLTTLHPGIYRYQTRESLEKVFGALESKLKNPLPEGEFFTLVSQLANQIYCGHTYLNPYNQDGILRERLFNGKTYLPFYFTIVGGKFIVTANASSNNLAKGSEIQKINGVSAKAIIEKLLTVTKGDGKNAAAHRRQSIELARSEAERYALFDWYFPFFFPPKDDAFTIEAVDFTTRKTSKFQIPAVTKTERTNEVAKRYGKTPTYDDGWKFELQDNSTAYLKIDNSITWRLKTIKFKEFLANAFAEIKAKNVQNLIIDLRGNDGGDMDIGFELSRYLAKEKLPPYAEGKALVRNTAAQPDLLKYIDAYGEKTKSILTGGVPANTYRKYDESYFEILGRENYPAVEPDKNNFLGKAFVIADASNASATFQFLDYVQKNKLASVAGQTTGGNKQGINGGNYFFLRLPNSLVEIDIPIYFQPPPTPQKDEGVSPNIRVKRQPQDIANNLDRELLTIKNLIEKN